MLDLTGQSIIGFGRSASTSDPLYGFNAATGEQLTPAFYSAGEADLNQAVELASKAFPVYRALPKAKRSDFLKEIANQIEALGDQLITRVMEESALPEGRVRGERDRTCGQLRFFARIVEEGSWVDARIDTADPNRKPLPKSDIRSMMRPVGPVAVFCASNFPLAFSVAGGDTASALAGGNPVVVNSHFSHPGTAELVGVAIQTAAKNTAMPEGVFSLLFSAGHKVGQQLVGHPGIKGGGFTGSRRGGLALLKIAQTRPEPIPFYAEMSSVNPVFVLPGALGERGEQISAGLHGSMVLGVGQFCTNPGIVLLSKEAKGDQLISELSGKLRSTSPAPMLNRGLLENYQKLVTERAGDSRVATAVALAPASNGATPALFETDTATFLQTPELMEEVFGPSSLVVRYGQAEELLQVAESLEGNLTATIHSGPGDEELAQKLSAILETKVGRILFQGYPTGVEVCQAMVHGGPYPSTSDGRSTSVGGRAIDRFVRPVCFQDAPDGLLPEELRSTNPAGIMRVVNGQRTRDAA